MIWMEAFCIYFVAGFQVGTSDDELGTFGSCLALDSLASWLAVSKTIYVSLQRELFLFCF